MAMLRELLLALGIPLLVLLLAVTALERSGGALPAPLRPLARHATLIWNVGIGLILGLSLLRWLLQRLSG